MCRWADLRPIVQSVLRGRSLQVSNLNASPIPKDDAKSSGTPTQEKVEGGHILGRIRFHVGAREMSAQSLLDTSSADFDGRAEGF